MFRDLLGKPERFSSPWEQEGLPQRIARLMSGEGERVAYLYERPDSSSFRYRVYNIIEALDAAPGCGIACVWFSASEITALRQALPRLGTLVLARVRYSRAVADLIAAARAFGVRVLFECDDLVFDLRYAQLISVTNDQPFHEEDHLNTWYAYVGRLNTTALHCDGGITTNVALAQKMEQVCRGPVSVIPNFLNRRQEDISRRLLAAKSAAGFRGDGRTMIGYFSGTPTHNKDFRICLDALIQLMEEDDRIDVRVVGFMEGHSDLARFGNRVDLIPLQDWVNLQVKIAEVDISIAPLQLNDFTNCKSELKFFEAAAVGTYSVLSSSNVFEHAVSGHDQASVIQNDQWLNALRAAVAKVREPESYGPNALQVAEQVYARYGWDRNTGQITAALRRPTYSKGHWL